MLIISFIIIIVSLKTIEDTRKLPPADKCFEKFEFLIGDQFPADISIIITIIIITIFTIIIIIIIIGVITIIVIVIVIYFNIVVVIFRVRSKNLVISKMDVFVVIAISLYISCSTISGSISDYFFIIVTLIVVALYF